MGLFFLEAPFWRGFKGQRMKTTILVSLKRKHPLSVSGQNGIPLPTEKYIGEELDVDPATRMRFHNHDT